MNHYHCDIIAYKAKEGDQLKDSTTISLVGYLNEAMSLKKAEELLPGRMYHLARIWQCNTCKMNQETTKFQQRAIKVMDQVEKQINGDQEEE